MQNDKYSSVKVADRVKLIAQSRNISISKMLSDIGLAAGTLTNFNKSMPKADNLAKIADYLNVSVDYLLNRTNTATLDETIQAACKITGLSEKAITMLSYSKENVSNENERNSGNSGLNHFIEDMHFMEFVHQLYKIFLLHKESEIDISELYFSDEKIKSINEVENSLDNAINLVQLAGFKTIGNSQYFDLCIQNAILMLQLAFQDWKNTISENDHTGCTQ